MSIRLRLALTFAALTAIAFALGGWLFEAQLSSGLLGLLDSQLTTQLNQVDHYISATVPASSEPKAANAAGAPAPGEYFFQVIDSGRRVRSASAEAGSAPLLSESVFKAATRGSLFVTTTVEGEHARLRAAPYPSRPGWVALAGASLDTFDRTLSDVTGELALGGMAAVIVAGVGAYLLARSALRPVERLRREVAAQSARDRGGLAVPATGDEIAALAQTMNELLGRLHEALARQRAFVADAGHELRNPFAILQGELELAGKPGRTPEELRAAVHSAGEEVARLARLANDLLLLARSDEDQLVVRPVPTDLRTMVDRSVARAVERVSASDVQCSNDVPAGLSAVVDPDRMRQALDNLLDNAIRFAPPASVITVDARRCRDGAVAISVADRGPGFPPDYLPHVFERFRRPDSSRARDSGGAGLGLAIVQAIALAHRGTVEARNREDGGAVVEIVLPEADAAPLPADDRSTAGLPEIRET